MCWIFFYSCIILHGEKTKLIFKFGYDTVCLKYSQFPVDLQSIPINHHKFPILNLSRIPQLFFSHETFPEICQKFAAPLQPER